MSDHKVDPFEATNTTMKKPIPSFDRHCGKHGINFPEGSQCNRCLLDARVDEDPLPRLKDGWEWYAPVRARRVSPDHSDARRPHDYHVMPRVDAEGGKTPATQWGTTTDWVVVRFPATDDPRRDLIIVADDFTSAESACVGADMWHETRPRQPSLPSGWRWCDARLARALGLSVLARGDYERSRFTVGARLDAGPEVWSVWHDGALAQDGFKTADLACAWADSYHNPPCELPAPWTWHSPAEGKWHAGRPAQDWRIDGGLLWAARSASAKQSCGGFTTPLHAIAWTMEQDIEKLTTFLGVTVTLDPDGGITVSVPWAPAEGGMWVSHISAGTTAEEIAAVIKRELVERSRIGGATWLEDRIRAVTGFACSVQTEYVDPDRWHVIVPFTAHEGTTTQGVNLPPPPWTEETVREVDAELHRRGYFVTVGGSPRSTHDPVQAPSHYTDNEDGVETLDLIRYILGDRGFVSFCLGNSVKYRRRAGKKEGATAEQDIGKAEFYEAVARNVCGDRASLFDPVYNWDSVVPERATFAGYPHLPDPRTKRAGWTPPDPSKVSEAADSFFNKETP